LNAQIVKAQQAQAPATLPQSGGDNSSTTLPLTIAVVGGALALTGFALRQFMVKN
jgi:hypothetical protein